MFFFIPSAVLTGNSCSYTLYFKVFWRTYSGKIWILFLGRGGKPLSIFQHAVLKYSNIMYSFSTHAPSPKKIQ